MKINNFTFTNSYDKRLNAYKIRHLQRKKLPFKKLCNLSNMVIKNN